MSKVVRFFAIVVFILFVLFSAVNYAHPSKKVKAADENQPPVVKILSPKNNSVYEWNSTVNYSINVSDAEDGESKFQEINSNEVFLTVRYVHDPTKLNAELNHAAQGDAPGLVSIKTSNCLNCHAFNSKLIGPSFYDIAKKYPATKTNIDAMIKHVREGSTGIWGNVPMPTHPELSREETTAMINWILKNAKDQTVTYYRGTEGSFKMKPAETKDKKGVMILAASYIDHGGKDNPQNHLAGQDVIVVLGK
jgi:cytochrome c